MPCPPCGGQGGRDAGPLISPPVSRSQRVEPLHHCPESPDAFAQTDLEPRRMTTDTASKNNRAYLGGVTHPPGQRVERSVTLAVEAPVIALAECRLAEKAVSLHSGELRPMRTPVDVAAITTGFRGRGIGRCRAAKRPRSAEVTGQSVAEPGRGAPQG
jgi:hypothetical protein